MCYQATRPTSTHAKPSQAIQVPTELLSTVDFNSDTGTALFTKIKPLSVTKGIGKLGAVTLARTV